MSNDAQECDRRFCHSDFGIPSDFAIRHSDLGIAAHGKLRRFRNRALGPWTAVVPRRGESADKSDALQTLRARGRVSGGRVSVWTACVFFRKLHELGVVGAKIDFFDHEHKEIIDFYQELLKEAAKYRIMVNFHGPAQGNALGKSNGFSLKANGLSHIKISKS